MIIGMVALYVFFSSAIPQWHNVQTARLQVAERQAVRDQISDLLSKFQERVAQFENLDQQIGLINSSLPSSMNIPELLATIESIASRSKVSLDQITFTSITQQQNTSADARKTTGQTKPFEISISMNISGGYSAVKDFMATLETEVRLIDTTNITLTPVAGVVKTPTTQFLSRIEAKTYYIAQPSFTLP